VITTTKTIMRSMATRDERHEWLVAMATRTNIARLILAIAGAMAMAWAIAVFPVFWSENVIVDVARAIVAGEAFKRDVLAAVDAPTETSSGSVLRSAVLSKAAMIRLRRADDAIRMGDPLVQSKLESLTRIVQETLQNAPDDPILWLVWFWLDSSRNGVQPDNLRFLRMSYELAPYEGWIAVKRNPVALAAFPTLPNDLAERAISEFVRLVRWGLVSEASAIAAGPGRPLRNILFLRLKDLDYEHRRVFAAAVYGQELDDVPVPGIAPPPPPVTKPVMPPDF
jgi:hypothetical protein